MSIGILGNDVLSLLGEIKSNCVWCGNCCEEEMFSLSDTEFPFIVKELLSLGNYALVQKHVRTNLTPLNIMGKYVFAFKERCPFWREEDCSLEKERPLVCKLFPLTLIALIDNPKLKLRQPLFSVSSPRKGKSCGIDSEYIIQRMKRIGEVSAQTLPIVQQIMAAALLDLNSLSYCFGQPLQRGVERFNPRPDGFFVSETEVSDLIMSQYVRRYRHLLVPGNEPYEKLSTDQIDNLISKNAVRRAKIKINKRIKHLKNHRNEVIEWYEFFRILNR